MQPQPPPTIPSFPPDEFERRIENARRLMSEQGVDCLLVTGEHNFRYFTGDIHPSPFQLTRPKFFVLPAAGEPFAIVAQGQDRGLRATTWLKDIRTWPGPRPEDDGVSLVVEAIRAAAEKHRTVGLELAPESRIGFPAGDFLRVRDMIQPIRMVDAEVPILKQLRLVKSAREIERVRRICQIVSFAFEALPAKLRMGETEWDVWRKLNAVIMERGATQTPKTVVVSGKYGYEQPNTGPTHRVLGPGDLMFIDTGCQYDHYWRDFDRHFAFGPPIDSIKRSYDVLHRATDAGIAAVRPGRRTSDVFKAMWDVIDAAGLAEESNVGRMGHGMGIVMPEPPSIKPGDHTEIRAGMVLNIEPSLAYVPPEDGKRRIMVHEENVAVTEDGCELLTRRAPPDIPVVS